MIFDSKDDDWLFITAPDMDGDGKRGLIDQFLYEDYLAREEKRIEDKFRVLDEIAGIDPLSDTDENDDFASVDYDTEEEEYDYDEEDEEDGDGAYDPQIGEIVDFINSQDEETREKIAERLYAWQAALEKSLDTSWHSEVEDGSKYGICPEDFESKEEYEEALENEKHWWVEYAEDGSEYGLNPYSFDSPNDYEDALYKAKYGWHDEVEGIDEFNLDPFDYSTREEYEVALAKAREEAKYEWREWVFDASECGIDPNDYETEEEYMDAYLKAPSSGMNETRSADKPAAADADNSDEKKRPNVNDENIYSYCMVEIESPFKQCLYYFPGDLELLVGDKVIVPYGKRELKGTVTETGEQRGADYPFDVAKIKRVKEKR